MQGNKITFQDLRDGLAADKEYSKNCEKLLGEYLAYKKLTKSDFTGPVSGLKCMDKLLRLWLGYEGLVSYIPGSNEPLPVSDFKDIHPEIFLSKVDLQGIKIDELEIDPHEFARFLFIRNLPLPAPDVEDKNPWFHGKHGSTEFIQIGDDPYHDKNLVTLIHDIVSLEERPYTDDREADKRQQAKLERKKQQDELYWLYREKRGCPVVDSDEYKLLWDELSRFYGITTELDELKQAVPSEWRLERKRLLNQEIEAIKGWCKHERESPTRGEEEVLKDYPSTFAKYHLQSVKEDREDGKHTSSEKNYFIKRGDNWRVRFNGGEEVDISDSKPIKTLVAFLESPGEEFNCADLYFRLHGEGGNNIPTANDDTEEHTQIDKKHNEAADQKTRTIIEKEIKVLIENIKIAKSRGDYSKAEESEAKLNKWKKKLREIYNATVCDNGSVTWGHCQFKDDRDKAIENITVQIDRLIKKVKKNEGLVGFGEYLQKYLKENFFKGKMKYAPPDDFPGWFIEV